MAEGSAGDSSGEDTIILCLEASKNLLEPLCNAQELQKELVPYVLNHSLQSSAFLKLPKAERQLRVKALTQQILSGESGGGGAAGESPAYMKEADSSEFSTQRFWAYLRTKYGTLGGHIEQTLRLLEPQLQGRRVVVLRFEGEAVLPSASLLVRASSPCSAAGAAAVEAARLSFDAGSFNVSAVSAWLGETPAGSRATPLWSRLVDECNRHTSAGAGQALQVLLLCTDVESTDTGPRALTLAAHLLKNDCKAVPYLSCMHFGEQSSERLAALQDICAWAGGLTLNVDEPSGLEAAAQGLASYLFGGPGAGGGAAVRAGDLGERREFYLKKQGMGTCFLSLPSLVEDAGASGAAAGACDKGVADIGTADVSFDVTVPSDSMVQVLSEVSLALPRRWSRSLRCWREHRGLRDVVFSEPGGLGLELDEPDLESSDSARRTWRLRATHPPASSLKLEVNSQLVAVNMMRVHGGTLRGEVAKRVACRPVSLTFRCSSSGIDRNDLGMVFSMATAEIVVSELREKYPPIKTKEPPLSLALERVSAARSPTPASARQRQAARVLEAASHGQSGAEEARGEPHALSKSPAVLYRLLMLCGSVTSIARVGTACRRMWQLTLDEARRPKDSAGGGGGGDEGEGAVDAQRKLWKWVLRWGEGPSRAQRLGFWRWCLGIPLDGGPGSSPAGSGPSAPPAVVLSSAMRADASGLLRLSQGLAGASLGSHIAAMTGSHMEKLLRGSGAGILSGLPPEDILEAFLRGPFHGRRLWLLAGDGLAWLASQCRAFQIQLAAHCPQLFKHFMGEGLAPELFYCWWLQRMLCGCAGDEETVRILDMFVFEQSYKVLLRMAVAVFKVLEPKLRGDIDQIMKVLLSPQTWGLDAGALLREGLATKVTRSVLRETWALDAGAP